MGKGKNINQENNGKPLIEYSEIGQLSIDRMQEQQSRNKALRGVAWEYSLTDDYISPLYLEGLYIDRDFKTRGMREIDLHLSVALGPENHHDMMNRSTKTQKDREIHTNIWKKLTRLCVSEKCNVIISDRRELAFLCGYPYTILTRDIDKSFLEKKDTELIVVEAEGVEKLQQVLLHTSTGILERLTLHNDMPKRDIEKIGVDYGILCDVVVGGGVIPKKRSVYSKDIAHYIYIMCVNMMEIEREENNWKLKDVNFHATLLNFWRLVVYRLEVYKVSEEEILKSKGLPIVCAILAEYEVAKRKVFEQTGEDTSTLTGFEMFWDNMASQLGRRLAHIKRGKIEDCKLDFFGVDITNYTTKKTKNKKCVLYSNLREFMDLQKRGEQFLTAFIEKLNLQPLLQKYIEVAEREEMRDYIQRKGYRYGNILSKEKLQLVENPSLLLLSVLVHEGGIIGHLDDVTIYVINALYRAYGVETKHGVDVSVNYPIENDEGRVLENLAAFRMLLTELSYDLMMNWQLKSFTDMTMPLYYKTAKQMDEGLLKLVQNNLIRSRIEKRNHKTTADLDNLYDGLRGFTENEQLHINNHIKNRDEQGHRMGMKTIEDDFEWLALRYNYEEKLRYDERKQGKWS